MNVFAVDEHVKQLSRFRRCRFFSEGVLVDILWEPGEKGGEDRFVSRVYQFIFQRIISDT